MSKILSRHTNSMQYKMVNIDINIDKLVGPNFPKQLLELVNIVLTDSKSEKLQLL